MAIKCAKNVILNFYQRCLGTVETRHSRYFNVIFRTELSFIRALL